MATLFKLLTERGAMTSETVGILLDRSNHGRFKSFADCLKNSDYQIDPEQYAKLLHLIEKDIYEQALYLALLQYYIMDRSGNWGESGEQQVKIGFCRNLLSIPPQETLTSEHATEFLAVVNKKLQLYEIGNLTLDAAKKTFYNYQLKFLGKTLSDKQFDIIGAVLKFIGSSKFLYISNHGTAKQLIWGTGKEMLFDEYPITVIQEEIVRPPAYVLATVAAINTQGIFIRDEALWNIFYQKWIPVFEQDGYTKSRIQSDPFWAISQGIKEKALTLYGIKTKEELLKRKEEVFKDIRETIVFHEVGHAVADDYLLTAEQYAVAVGTGFLAANHDDPYDTFREFLADFSPQLGKKHGAMFNMVKVSKKDPIRAQRLFWLYFSDVWFFDTEDMFMYHYSDFLSMILIRYVTPKLEIDFSILEGDLFHDPKAESPNSLLDRVISILASDMNKILEMCKGAKFQLVGKEQTFEFFKTVRLSMLKKEDPKFDIHHRRDLARFWWKVFMNIYQISDSKEKIQGFIKTQKTANLKKMMILSAGRKKAESYNYDHRKYIAETLKGLGVVPKAK